MKLLVDIGNTRLKWILFDGDDIHQRDALVHHKSDPKQWGDRLWKQLPRPSQVVIANVTGAEVAAALSDWIQRQWDLETCFVSTESTNYGISNGYDSPQKLGVDRWVAMIGGRRLSQQNQIIVDCGTVVTIDALTRQGQHLGGVMLPGVRLMHAALYNNTQIPEQEIGNIVFLGKNTGDCIWGGTIYAITAAIDRVSQQMSEVLGDPVHCFLTGGNSTHLLPYLENSYQLEPDLIFSGLKTIAEQSSL